MTLGRAQLNFGELLLAQDTLRQAALRLGGDQGPQSMGRDEDLRQDTSSNLLQQADKELRFVQDLIARKHELGQAPIDRQQLQPLLSSSKAGSTTADTQP